VFAGFTRRSSIGFRPAPICRELNLRSVPWQHGRPWSLYAVREVLRNPGARDVLADPKQPYFNGYEMAAPARHAHPGPHNTPRARTRTSLPPARSNDVLFQIALEIGGDAVVVEKRIVDVKQENRFLRMQGPC
jgi:hypothetical protein